MQPLSASSASKIPPELVLEHLIAVLRSPEFADSPRLSRFLKYVVEQTLNGHAADLKEYRVGVDVFDRPADYDPKTDPVVRVEAEVGSGMNGARRKVRRLLADPLATTVIVEHRDRLGRMNTELVEAALSAHGRRLVVLDDGEVTDDLVRDMVEVLTSFCARLYGRRSARNRAIKAVGCAQRGVGPAAFVGAGGQDDLHG